ncbi:MAG: hypothetical protein IPL63_11980 [Saprospiraceae bacterium]|nr:hypothetical protein [Saprospiraceae bacterium]MBK6566934.1 hypothetical protein [Saprospiraceae bacterium]MBK6783821.1 hypothetical protein [Saprospiraceae bacterium]MBK8372386.1 hypothetical protein [Saprospiraceae bacterium]MBK8548054.1 hypothetical protein [Saprospiraceae bacterium]
MKYIFFINGMIQMIAGIVLFLKPGLLFTDVTNSVSTMVILKMYAILSMAFGGICLVIGKNGNEYNLLKSGALIIMMFHLIIAFQSYGAYIGGYLPNMGAFGFHLTTAIILTILFLRNREDTI